MQRINEKFKELDIIYKNHPLISFLNDNTKPPLGKLSFIPLLSHFAMSFSDVNKYCYRDLKSDDIFQKIVNEHTYEDELHSALFLRDLKHFDCNSPQKFSESLTTIWNSNNVNSRKCFYELVGLLYNAIPIEKYIILESVERNGNILFKAFSSIAEELSLVTGNKYVYFGHHHFELESGRAISELYKANINYINNYQLNFEVFTKSCFLIDKVYEIFNLFWLDLYNYAANYTNKLT
nr:hypothetical protein GTC16762_28980 [Pigmentibacter ruber]